MCLCWPNVNCVTITTKIIKYKISARVPQSLWDQNKHFELKINNIL